MAAAVHLVLCPLARQLGEQEAAMAVAEAGRVGAATRRRQEALMVADNSVLGHEHRANAL